MPSGRKKVREGLSLAREGQHGNRPKKKRCRGVRSERLVEISVSGGKKHGGIDERMRIQKNVWRGAVFKVTMALRVSRLKE